MSNLIVIDEEKLETVKSMAAMNYLPSQIGIQLGLSKKYVLALYNHKESDFRQAYDAGVLEATYNIFQKQKELAESGNITATQIFTKEQQRIARANVRDRILYGNLD